MALPLLAAGKAALTLAPYLGLFHRRKRLAPPRRYVTPEDVAAAEATRSRLTGVARNTGQGARIEAMRRLRQRGIDTAPASEATLARVNQAEAEGVQHAGDVAEEQLYNMGTGNLRFEQSKYLRQMGLEEAKNASLFNSLLEYTPMAMDALDRIHSARPPAAGTTRRVFNQGTGRFEPMGPLSPYDTGDDESDLGY